MWILNETLPSSSKHCFYHVSPCIATRILLWLNKSTAVPLVVERPPRASSVLCLTLWYLYHRENLTNKRVISIVMNGSWIFSVLLVFSWVNLNKHWIWWNRTKKGEQQRGHTLHQPDDAAITLRMHTIRSPGQVSGDHGKRLNCTSCASFFSTRWSHFTKCAIHSSANLST